MIRIRAFSFAASLATAVALTSLAARPAEAQQPAPAVTVAQPAGPFLGGPRVEQRQPTVSASAAFHDGTSNAYRRDTVVITASTLGLIALVVLLLLVL